MGGKQQTRVGSLKEGRYMLIDGEPCEIKKIQTSSPGKHGSAKSRIMVVGVFDDRKRSVIRPVDTKVDVPIIDKNTGMITAILNDTIQLMDMNSYETFDVPMPDPDEVEGEIKQGVKVEYWETLGRIKVIRVKE